jgi:hypothetical protein
LNAAFAGQFVRRHHEARLAVHEPEDYVRADDFRQAVELYWNFQLTSQGEAL